MAEFLQMLPNGAFQRVIRDDAVKLSNPDRWYVPTTRETKWVNDWSDFRSAGGHVSYPEDQCGIQLLLPPGYKFGIGFTQYIVSSIKEGPR